MQEIAPGVWHWIAPHPRIHIDVSSYFLSQERVLIDPLVPPEGLGWFEERARPEHVLMTNRHHDRDAWRFREAFGCTVHCVASGMHELAGRGPAEAFEPGEELPGGIIPYEVGGICPDEMALYVPAHRALACADGAVRWPGKEGIVFVPDELMDDPERTKRRLREAYARLLDLDFDMLLLAHGDPVTSGGKQALRALTESAG